MRRNMLIITGLVLLISIAAIPAFAHDSGWNRGEGYGHMMGSDNWGAGMHRGYGPMMGSDSWGPGMHRGYMDDRGVNCGNLSADEMAKLDKQHIEFLKETESIRQKLYQKELALRSELAKENPDTGEASRLQSAISNLQGDLDQRRLAYEIKVRKSAPNVNRGSGDYGPMMGYGSRGGEYCRW